MVFSMGAKFNGIEFFRSKDSTDLRKRMAGDSSRLATFILAITTKLLAEAQRRNAQDAHHFVSKDRMTWVQFYSLMLREEATTEALICRIINGHRCLSPLVPETATRQPSHRDANIIA